MREYILHNTDELCLFVVLSPTVKTHTLSPADNTHIFSLKIVETLLTKDETRPSEGQREQVRDAGVLVECSYYFYFFGVCETPRLLSIVDVMPSVLALPPSY